MKTLNIIFTILFLSFAALQYNDPDPYVWIPIYAYAALLCFLASKSYFNKWLYICGLMVYTTYACYLFVSPNGVLSWITDNNMAAITGSMNDTQPWIEATREFFGLFIVIVTFIINLIWRPLARQRYSAVSSAS